MSNLLNDPASLDELHPHLLFRAEAGQAHFATWRLADGQEALAIFTTADAAGKYQAELPARTDHKDFQPPREKLLTIFGDCLAAGIRIAALDPLAGGARTLFDLSQVVAAAGQQAAD
jgi:hypothetical protein